MTTIPEITIESDEHPQLYAAQIKSATTLDELKAAVELWKPYAFDAWQVVSKMTPADFNEYLAGCALERQGIFGGDVWYEKYKDIQFPGVMFRTAMIATDNECPWGYAFTEMVEQNFITKTADGIYHLTE